ncbi:MAG: serine/threonine protein kinase [Myxococcales bacterium]|nr:serine/threonine protein kinase [Myxococcales bacterium]
MRMECLDANVVQDLMSGALESAMRSAVLGHLDTCEECRQLLSVTARDAARVGRQQRLALDETALPTSNSSPAGDSEAAPLAGGSEAASPSGDSEAAPFVGASAITMRSGAAPGDLVTPARIRTQPSPRRKLGQYSLIERLGAGAMGIVWRAEDTKLRRNVALKLLKRPDDALVERLQREAQAMARVGHPNVVTVYESGLVDGETYIAMELVEGKSLRAWQTGARHTIPEIVEAYIAAGRGLAAAHDAGIFLRVFKPDNVLFGKDGLVRVTDFGLAAAKPTTGDIPQISDVNLTTQGSVLGTPAYMAPEQFTGGNVDSRTDQFNFCVALYEALYGERPFAGNTFEELGDHVCEGRVKPPPAGTRVSGGLRAIVVRGMSAKPGDRFPAMDHLLKQLGRDRARPWRRTSIVSAALAAVLGLGLLSDSIVRDRVSAEISQSFKATGTQIERATTLQTRRFQGLSNLVVLFKALLDVTSHRDQADFGLATPEQDAEELSHIHETLTSQDWSLVRELGDNAHHSEVAVGDYKGRLLYTSAAPNEWQGNLLGMPTIKNAVEAGKGYFDSIVRYDEPTFVSAKLFGATPPPGIALMFVRSLDHGGEVGGVFMQFVDGADVLAGIRLDDTKLGLVALDGTAIGDLPNALIDAAPKGGEIAEVMSGGRMYRVQARTIPDLAGQPIGRVVMARPLESVLQLFPGARTVFAIATLAALLVAFATALRARRITNARI